MTSSTTSDAPNDTQQYVLGTPTTSQDLQIDHKSFENEPVEWQLNPLIASDDDRLLVMADAQMQEDALPSFREEALALWSLGWQVSLTNFCRISLTTISTMFLGTLGSRELAASALANVWISGVQIFIFGFAVSVCTLCGQAYGAKNYRLVGVWLQLALLLLLVLSLPVMISFFYVDWILSIVTDDQEILALADTYARLLAPSVLPQAIYCAFSQYLQAQEIVRPATIIGIASIAVSISSDYCFIYGCGSISGLGFIGAPLAQTVTFLFQPTTLALYAFWYKGFHKKTWFGFDLRACFQLERLRTFGLLSAGMTINIALDEWVYNVISAFASTLGAWNLAANSILFNLWGLIFSMYWGFGLPTQVRVANFLGANQPVAAKRTYHVGFVLGGLTAFVSAILVFAFCDPIARLFTRDPTVLSAIMSTMPVFAMTVFISGLHIIISAVVEAMSLATTLVVITTIGSWVFMLPASYGMGLYWHGGLSGLWWGSLVGESVKFSLMAVALRYIDWREVAHRAVIQSENSLQPDNKCEENILLRSALVLPSTSTIADTAPELAVHATPRIHFRHQTAIETAEIRSIVRSNSYGSVTALHN